jgi:phosphohistidine swiveling domain-containing protein
VAGNDNEAVAQGTLVAGRGRTGIFCAVRSIEDVLQLLRADGLGELIVFIEQASVTNISPIVSRVGGVISSAGGPTSHLAIVTRGFQTTCVVGADFVVEPSALEGKTVEVREDGSVRLVG